LGLMQVRTRRASLWSTDAKSAEAAVRFAANDFRGGRLHAALRHWLAERSWREFSVGGADEVWGPALVGEVKFTNHQEIGGVRRPSLALCF
jgi:hypothetical protein